MINFKRIIAGLMAGATAISFAACSSSSTSSTTDSADSNNTSTGTTIDDEIENPVSIDDISINAGDKVEPAELQYLAYL